jgi:signal transduction histidine kinase
MGSHPGAVDPCISIETARASPQEIMVRVSDSGPGIAPDETEQIFESFYSTKASGLGIGLSICRKMIESHGGRLWTSPNPAGGAVFHFTLPVTKIGD